MKYEVQLLDVGDSPLGLRDTADMINRLDRLCAMGWKPKFMMQPHLMLLLRELHEVHVHTANITFSPAAPGVRLTTPKARRRAKMQETQ
jgi:hypothetical protein